MSKYVAEPKPSREGVKVELDLFDYATKADLKNATGVDASSFAKKIDLVNWKCSVYKNIPTNLSNLKTKVHILDVDKLVPIPADLSKLSDVVNKDFVKKDVYKTQIKSIGDKIPDLLTLLLMLLLMLKQMSLKVKYLVLLT